MLVGDEIKRRSRLYQDITKETGRTRFFRLAAYFHASTITKTHKIWFLVVEVIARL